MNDNIIIGRIDFGVDYYKGEKGDKPVKGVDYFTEEDIAEIAGQIDVSDLDIDLTDYATKDYVDSAIENIDIPTLTETDPTVPAWAKSATKPTYTASEVGALPSDTQLFSGNYNDLSNKPTLFSGNYNDLTNKPTIPAEYTLPTATTSTLGGVKVDGSTITIADGVISATSSGGSSSWDLSDRIGAGTDTDNTALVFNSLSNTASGAYAIAEGSGTQATGNWSHAEGGITHATGRASHAEGWNTTATGNQSHAEGSSNVAGGQSAHAEGQNSSSNGQAAHAEGYNNSSSGNYSHTEGQHTLASATASHAEGWNTRADSQWQHAEGKSNVSDANDVFQNIAGNGQSWNDYSTMFARDWNGNEYLSGDIYVNATDYSTTKINSVGQLSTTNAGGKKVATEEYVDTAIANIPSSGGSSYTAGNGIDIDENGVISKTPSAVPLLGMLYAIEANNTGIYNSNVWVTSFIGTNAITDAASRERHIQNLKTMGMTYLTQGFSGDNNGQYLKEIIDAVGGDDTTTSLPIVAVGYDVNDQYTGGFGFQSFDYSYMSIVGYNNKPTLIIFDGSKSKGSNNRWYFIKNPEKVFQNKYFNSVAGLTSHSIPQAIDEVATNLNTRIPASSTATDGTFLLTSTVSSGSATYAWQNVTIGGSY